MAWTDSRISRAFLADAVANTAAFDLGGAGVDAFKVSLHNNTITPDQNVASASFAFNAGVWTTTNEVTDATGWPSGGRSLVSPVVDSATAATVFFDGADTASANSTTTLAANHGCLVYDDTLAAPVADQGLSYNYFGGAQQVTNGSFTIVWHVNGIWRITL